VAEELQFTKPFLSEQEENKDLIRNISVSANFHRLINHNHPSIHASIVNGNTNIYINKNHARVPPSIHPLLVVEYNINQNHTIVPSFLTNFLPS